MSMFDSFRKPLVDSAVWRILKIQFHRSTMSDTQKEAYNELVKQVDLRVMERACDQQQIIVPASIKPHDAYKALKLIKLEFDASWDFHVKWEADSAKSTLLSEKKQDKKNGYNQPPAPDAPKP